MKNTQKGFSLIELSIVLIIIGLLVAGITGGASLISSARLRGTMSEVTTYRVAINSFYSAKDTYPGDYSSTATDGTEQNDKIDTATEVEAAWLDLYRNGGIDGTYNAVATTGDGLMSETGLGKSKTDGAGWMMGYYNPTSGTPLDFNAIALTVEEASIAGTTVVGATAITTNVIASVTPANAETFDIKMDDGVANDGDVRGLLTDCATGADYDVEDTDKECVPAFSIEL